MTSFSKSPRDINFATYGTFLEGLLSEDRKAAAIYRDAFIYFAWLQHGGIACRGQINPSDKSGVTV
jgi:hypothetical protein